MLELTKKQKVILVNRVVSNVRKLPNYNPKKHGVRVIYNKPFEISLTGPKDEISATSISRFIKEIELAFSSEGLKVLRFISYITHDYRILDHKKFFRKNLNVIIKEYKFI